MPLRAVCFLVVLQVCSCSEQSTSSPPAGEASANARGLQNANAMVANAKLCEPDTGVGSAQACEQACERACALNHSNSCANWAALLEAEHPSRAEQLYAQACKGGSGIGCEGQAAIVASAGDSATELYLDARRYHRIHCEQGYGRSCEQLAVLFERGLGGAVSPELGRVFRRTACSLGRSGSCRRDR